ncbi:unnamed protein product [Schistosoma margrebowiei]|uniref:Secreted protein n=1 Tax=Schistosoma margrebowiei TaxID=48269 RepID=A0A3P8DC32_9TREM|nr:unnamed protein product [Schistosoma margrebowiei]
MWFIIFFIFITIDISLSNLDSRQIPRIQRGGGESIRNSGSNHTGVSKSSANHVNSKNPNQQRNQPNHRSDSIGPRGQNMCAPIVS